MVTKLKRYNVTFSPELQTLIEKEAQFQHRDVSRQITFILDKYFLERKNELDFFRPELREAERTSQPQHFETPVVPALEHLYKLRENVDREKK